MVGMKFSAPYLIFRDTTLVGVRGVGAPYVNLVRVEVSVPYPAFVGISMVDAQFFSVLFGQSRTVIV